MSAPPRDPLPAPGVARLALTDFRSYAAASLDTPARLIALVGENGAGKTNLLEALSLLSPGRGLRRADLADLPRAGGPGGFAVALTLADGTRLGIGAARDEDGVLRRTARVEGVAAPGPGAFAERVRMVWLTPALDPLFTGPAGDRRRFVDRMTLAVDPGHGARVSAFERALRARNRLLEDPDADAAWLSALEREAAELGVAVAAARRETVGRLAALIAATRDPASPFPAARLSLEGELETLLGEATALDAEDAYRAWLREGRPRDRAAGRTLRGPQASDLSVTHDAKGTPAAACSTGEQKALLVGLVLAQARLVREMSGLDPLVLLDEVAAHLDPRRRGALYEALGGLGGQTWMTGADPALFAELPGGALRFEVVGGGVTGVG